MSSILNKKNFEAISAHDLQDKLGNIHIIDVRENEEFEEGHIPTAKNIPMDSLLAAPKKYISKDDKYYIVCELGVKSKETCEKLSSEGYNVVNIYDGFDNYEDPVQR
ncbi:rhodanese-like domain-containing protein [Clostridium felsineum]|uniref:Thiosulfate sulfurtransferase GlpE n=1 Tax=Clostridium felsineum TaxID=36839 RepID=A0A1S8LZ35_9CLOT|nr:rhodanese-like domain-containing protein [Clostridium felsineum]URZ04580.1 Thiosulfate sulfurtransferase GlpE [Clostridium felsineum]URZ09105.1 Thiosulfate sulfurtransferase GlpE [Clostridium felsineum]URZ13792.1 Thiosulfate sulfurtransferase GlpE [Clostridium felsineum]URZ18689.1 Thiosulfate sulfurtransferase GlpE [Clostridium felsineum DSM 794]